MTQIPSGLEQSATTHLRNSRNDSADHLLDGRVVLHQPESGYRVSIDAVFLAAAVPAKPGQKVLEVGLGTAAASLCLAARVEGLDLTGLELQPELAAIARRNVKANGREGVLSVVEGDLLHPPPAISSDSFDHVFANPPYVADGNVSPHPTRALAHAEGEAELKDWIAFAVSRLKRKGSLTLIHRADRVDEILSLLRGKAGEVVIFPLWPKAGVAAKRVVITARKGVRAPAVLLPGLILHEPDGSFTSAAQAVLRQGLAIP